MNRLQSINGFWLFYLSMLFFCNLNLEPLGVRATSSYLTGLMEEMFPQTNIGWKASARILLEDDNLSTLLEYCATNKVWQDHDLIVKDTKAVANRIRTALGVAVSNEEPSEDLFTSDKHSLSIRIYLDPFSSAVITQLGKWLFQFYYTRSMTSNERWRRRRLKK